MSTKIKAQLQQLLSQEQGAVVREWGARFPVALVYPQVYAVGMGNLGFQTIYHLLNAHPGFVCERAFLPSPEEAEEHRRTRTPILSLESQRPLREFAAVAFSISFEADYPYVLDLLAGAGIPLRAAERGPGDPLVLAGGVATSSGNRTSIQHRPNRAGRSQAGTAAPRGERPSILCPQLRSQSDPLSYFGILVESLVPV